MENRTERNASLNDANAPLDLHPGLLIGEHYEILSLLGRGGMSVAYKALDKQLNRVVTVKFLLPERLSNPKNRVRFQREAMTAGQLQHPGIAKVFAFDFDEPLGPFLVMEYINGQTLARRIEGEGQLPIEETIDIFTQVTDALAFAHSHGVLHRDIKPSNIMLDSRHRGQVSSVKLVDFGLAKLIATEDLPAWQVTNTGELVGSPLYMSPEQARGAQLDHRSDLYSLGCTIYETLTGSPPHIGQTAVATILKHETDKPLTLSEASLGGTFPADLEILIAKLLAANPNDRYQSAADLLTDLRKTRSNPQADDVGRTVSAGTQSPTGRKISSPTIWTFAIGILLVTALPPLAIAWFVTKHDQPKQVEENALVAFEVQTAGLETVWLEAKAFIDKARAYKADGRYAEAITEYKKALVDYNRIFDKRGAARGLDRDPDKADTLVEMADCLVMIGNYKEAKDCVEQFADISQNIWGPGNRTHSDTLIATGSRYLRLPAVDRAEVFKISQPLFDKATSIIERYYGSDKVEFALCLSMQADACLDGGFLQEATSRCDKYIKLVGGCRSETTAPKAQVLATAARVYAQSGDLKKLDYVTRTLETAYQDSEKSDQVAMAPSLLIAANALMAITKSDGTNSVFVKRALSFYQAVLTNYEGSDELSGEASRKKPGLLLACYDNLGRYYRHEGDRGRSDGYRLAELYYKRALPLLKGTHQTDPLSQQILKELDYLAKAQGDTKVGKH